MNMLEIFGVILYCSAGMCIRYVREWARHAKPRSELAPWMAVYGFVVIVSIFMMVTAVTTPALNQPAPAPISWIYLVLTLLLVSEVLISLVRLGVKGGKTLWQRASQG